jgi:membrane protein implicated in regulation of membrane protease activity
LRPGVVKTVTDITLLTTFLITGGIGFLFLLASLVVGDIFDAVGIDFGLDASHDFGIFDSRVISVFLVAFGGFGTIGVQVGLGAVGSSLCGLLGGVFFAAMVFFFGKFLYGQQSTSSVREEDLIGRTAQVTVRIQAGGIGQISCRVGDDKIEKLARTASGEEIQAGAIVRIESIAGDSVIVSHETGERFSLFSGEA